MRPGLTFGFTAALALALIVGCTIFAGSANASCGISSFGKLVRLPRSPVFPTRTVRQHAAKSMATDDDASIVGLWHVQFLSDGMVFDEGFNLWHSDGTEVLNDSAPPQPANGAGTVCLGVYRAIEQRPYRLKHPFWSVDADGNTSGTGVVLEEVTVGDSGNDYSGSFTFIAYDLEGHVIDQVEGELQAERITPD